MPSFITHALISEQIRQAVTDQQVSDAIQKHPAAFAWGAQGPDLLFFRYGFKKTPNFIGPLGTRIHKERTPEFFQEVCRYLVANKGTDHFEADLSYLCGFVCHYCLDRAIHPYVYFMQEKMRDQYYSSVVYGIHMKLETDLDTALYQKLTGDRNSRHYKLDHSLIERDADIDALCSFFSHILNYFFGECYPPEEIRPCVINQYKKEAFMLEPTGIVSFLGCKWMDFTRGQRNVQCANCRPRRVNYDILNLEHSQWKNFRLKDVPRQESVPELLAGAKEDAVQLIAQVAGHVRSETPFPPMEMPTFDDGNPDLWGM